MFLKNQYLFATYVEECVKGNNMTDSKEKMGTFSWLLHSEIQLFAKLSAKNTHL